MVSRRSLLTTGAALAGLGALSLAGCSSDQINSFETQFAAVVGAVQSAVANGLSTAVSYIPTVESVLETAASLFGPAYATLVTVGSTYFNELVAALQGVVTSLAPPAAHRLAARLGASSPNVPVTVGYVGSVKVIGWKA